MSNDSISNKLWSACNKMRQDPGTTGALQYVEQFSWLLFLKVYEEIENEYEAKATFEGKTYNRNIDNEYRWSVWTGKDTYITGPDLLEFVQTKLFPYLRKLSGNRTKEIIAEIFNNTQNRMEDGYLLREVVDVLASVDFFGDEDSFAVSSIYEGLFARMKSSDIKPLAEFHTPRVIARFMTEMVTPKIGQTIYDPCNGPSGFLTEAYHFMRPQAKNISDNEKLQKETFFGKELKSLPFILGTMNMILNGIATPNIRRMNTLSINLLNLTEKYDIIMTNPPFSGTVRGVETNFPYPSSQTEILFLQHCLRSLKDGGKCAIIFPESVLFTIDDQSYVNTKKELLQQFNLHTIVRLPKGAFEPYTDIPVNILFFEKLGKTKEINFYELPLPIGYKNFSKTKPIRQEYLMALLEEINKNTKSDHNWEISINEIEKRNYNLDFKNPNSNNSTLDHNLESILDKFDRELLEAEKIKQQVISQVLSTKVNNDWNEIELGRILKRFKEEIIINDNKLYKRVKIKLYNQGLELRDETLGCNIGTKKQFTVKSSQLLLSKIDARNGAFGLIPDELDGAIITGNFWAYDINTSLIDPDFFIYFTKTLKFLDFCVRTSQGTTNRKYLQEDLFLQQKILLPKKELQVKVVKVIHDIEKMTQKFFEVHKFSSLMSPAFIEKYIQS